MPVKMLKDFCRWSHTGLDGQLVIHKPRNIPFIHYENGMPCYEANMYIDDLLEDGNKDATLVTYAYHIIHLIKFIDRSPSLHYFSQLTDLNFRLFIQGLQAERKPNGELARTNNRVLEIGDRCLLFLKSIQKFHDFHLFIGEDKACAITIKEITKKKIIKCGMISLKIL